MTQIADDPLLATLIVRDHYAGANEFRVQARHVCTLALVGDLASRQYLHDAVHELGTMCRGELEQWAPQVRQALDLVGD